MSEERSKRILKDLRSFPPISDLTDDQLMWLVPRLQEIQFSPGEVLAKEGSPADKFYFLLEGEFEYRFDSGTPDERVYIAKPGNIGGRLPFSRLTHWNGTFSAITTGRILVGSTDIFPEMIHDAPFIIERLVAVMSDRIRYATKEDQQQDRLAALGKLSAGLAPSSVFSMLVIMALLTTVMTTPLLFLFMKGTELEPYLRKWSS